MRETLTIDVWSDLICPWCGIGQHRLDAALALFEHADGVEVVHHAFELDPGAAAGVTMPVRELLASRGMSADDVEYACKQAEQAAAADGISPYVLFDNTVGNTLLAHQLLAFAADEDLEDEAWKRLYVAYFGEQRSLFDIDSLLELATEIGLDAGEARAALEDGRYLEQVRWDEQEATRVGARGVPFFLFDGRWPVSGAQPAEQLLELLQKAWEHA